MAVIDGTSADETITGTDGDDRIDGFGGIDTLIGGLGDDRYTIRTGSEMIVENIGEGADVVFAIGPTTYTLPDNVEILSFGLSSTGTYTGYGNALDNIFWMGRGDETYDGGAGSDTADFGSAQGSGVTVDLSISGAQSVGGSFGFETLISIENLIGSIYADTLIGNDQNNRLEGYAAGNSAADTLAGGLGDDTYISRGLHEVMIEGANAGTDTVIAWLHWTLGDNFENLTMMGNFGGDGFGNALNNVLTASANGNHLYGMGGNDTLQGGVGIDWLDGGAGLDTLIGGANADTYYLYDSGDVVVELVGEGHDRVETTIANYTLTDNVEDLIFVGAGAFAGTGNALGNYIFSGAENDTLNGAAGDDDLYAGLGNDTLDGGVGADLMRGAYGDDLYIVDNTGDVTTEVQNGGTDTVQSSISWTLSDNLENLLLTGSSAINGVGNALNNLITGNGAANALDGHDGADTLDGGAGADTMSGGGGNDMYYVDDAGDVVAESAGGGADVVRSSVTHMLGADVENLLMLGSAGIWAGGNALANVIIGNSGANKIWTDAGADFLDGGAGADTMLGGAGNDVYYVDQAGDVLQEDVNAGIDTVRSSITHILGANFENMLLVGAANSAGGGNALNNLILGGVGNNKIWSGVGSDSLSGGAGNDTLHGGAGLDFLTGGADADAFVFDTAPVASQADRITDFSVADDTIWLENAVFAKLGSVGDLNAAFFRVGAAAADANDYIIYNSANGALYYDSNGNAAGGSTLIAMIGANHALTNQDFLIV
jgi:Ca2+-binding RTX toxin-like protein